MLASRSQPPLDDDAAFIVFVARFHAIFDKQLKPCNADSLSTVSEAITETRNTTNTGQSTGKCGQTAPPALKKQKGGLGQLKNQKEGFVTPPSPLFQLSN